MVSEKNENKHSPETGRRISPLTKLVASVALVSGLGTGALTGYTQVTRSHDAAKKIGEQDSSWTLQDAGQVIGDSLLLGGLLGGGAALLFLRDHRRGKKNDGGSYVVETVMKFGATSDIENIVFNYAADSIEINAREFADAENIAKRFQVKYPFMKDNIFFNQEKKRIQITLDGRDYDKREWKKGAVTPQNIIDVLAQSLHISTLEAINAKADLAQLAKEVETNLLGSKAVRER